MLNNCLCVVSVCVCIHSYLITWSQSPLCPLSSYPESDKEETAGLGAPSTCCPYWHQISSLHNGLFSYLLFGYDTAENAEWRQHAAHSPIIRKQLNTICCLGVSLFSLVPLRLLSFPVYSVWMSYSMFVHSYRHDSLKKERKLSALSLQDPKVFPDSSEKNSSARCSQQKPPCEDKEGCMQMFEFSIRTCKEYARRLCSTCWHAKRKMASTTDWLGVIITPTLDICTAIVDVWLLNCKKDSK